MNNWLPSKTVFIQVAEPVFFWSLGSDTCLSNFRLRSSKYPEPESNSAPTSVTFGLRLLGSGFLELSGHMHIIRLKVVETSEIVETSVAYLYQLLQIWIHSHWIQTRNGGWVWGRYLARIYNRARKKSIFLIFSCTWICIQLIPIRNPSSNTTIL